MAKLQSYKNEAETIASKRSAPTDGANGFLCVKNLSKSFEEGTLTRTVLKNASARLGRGEFLAVVGKSGTGKSTLLNLISGIDSPDRGSIWIEGEDLTALNERQRTLFRRRHIGFVFQFFNLIPTLTVWENVTLPLELSGNHRQPGFENAKMLLDSVGLIDRRDSFPDLLSGGEQQRVAIARALVHNPLLVLADEPTGNLDEENGKQVLSLLDRLTRESGKNLIMVTHSRGAASYADRILYLREGRLLENL